MAKLLAAAALLCASCAAFDIGDVDVPARGAAVPDEGLTVALEHALSDGPDGARVWSKRSTLTYREASRYAGLMTGSAATITLTPAAFSEAEAAAFKQLVAEGSAYSIRLPSILSQPNSPPVVASVPACALARARFAERLSLQLDTTAHVVSLGYALRGGGGECTDSWQVSEAMSFDTQIVALAPVSGPLPKGRVEGIKGGGKVGAAGGAEGEKKEETPKSFFQKYWYYIVPAVLIMTMGGAEPPAEPGKPGGPVGPSAGGARAPTRKA